MCSMCGSFLITWKEVFQGANASFQSNALKLQLFENNQFNFFVNFIVESEQNKSARNEKT